MHYWRIHINASQTVQGHHPDRICILVHHAQPIHIIFMNTHYNGFLWTLWKLTLRKILPWLRFACIPEQPYLTFYFTFNITSFVTFYPLHSSVWVNHQLYIQLWCNNTCWLGSQWEKVLSKIPECSRPFLDSPPLAPRIGTSPGRIKVLAYDHPRIPHQNWNLSCRT